jgi:hypothetical protein
LADLHASEFAIQGAVVQGTNGNQALAWNHYRNYLSSIGLSNDWFLDSFSLSQKHRILRAFAHAIRENRFSSSKSGKTIKSEKVRATLDCVAQTSWLNEQTQDLMQINDLHSFYNANLEDTMLLTHPQNHKQQ